MKLIKVAVIGIGFIGVTHIEAIRRSHNTVIVAICNDVNPQALVDKFNIPTGYDDYKKMISIEKPDFIHICTPNDTHFEIAKYALHSNVNVICEKPFTKTIAEAIELTALSKEKNLINAVNFHSRFYPMVRQIKDMVENSEVGNIFSIHGGYFQDWLFLETDYTWRLESSQSGDSRAVADIGSHWIDTVEYVTNQKIVKVFADFAIFHKTRKKPLGKVESYSNQVVSKDLYEDIKIDTEDYAQILLEFDSGAKGNLIVSQVFAGKKNQMVFSVSGSKETLHWDSENSNEVWIGKRGEYNQIICKDPSIMHSCAASLSSYPGGHVEGFPDAFKHCFHSIYSSTNTTLPIEYATFSDGLREMKICDAITQSAKLGKWISIS